jgi:hypothetical protein
MARVLGRLWTGIAALIARKKAATVWLLLASVNVLSLGTAPAFAGPPFVTDDPEPADYGHFVGYLFSAGTRACDETSGTAVGLDLSYGVLPDTQISLVVPFEYEPGAKGGTRFALHEVAFGARYRFLQEDQAGWLPQVTISSAVAIPMSQRTPKVFLSLWAQKSFGEWTTFGGGGFNKSTGDGDGDFWSFGWGLTRQLTPHFALGVEAFGQTRDGDGGKGSASAGIGAIYDLSEEWHILGSVNSGVLNRRDTNQITYYAAIEWTI